MIKHFTFFFLIIFCFFSKNTFLKAQTVAKPGINYQAIVLNKKGGTTTNTTVSVQVQILQGGTTGEAVYTEVHDDVEVNAGGLFNLVIGQGTPQTNTFQSIDWGLGTHWLRTIIQISGETETIITEPVQFGASPYTYYAEYAEKLKDASLYELNDVDSGLIPENLEENVMLYRKDNVWTKTDFTTEDFVRLNENGKIDATQLPSSITTGTNYLGAWDPTTDEPKLRQTTVPIYQKTGGAQITANKGDFFVVGVASGNDPTSAICPCEIGDKIYAGAVSWEKVQSSNNLKENSVESKHIAPEEVKTEDIGDGAITGEKIEEKAIQEIHLDDNAVNTFKIKDGEVYGIDIRDGEISGELIRDGSITAEKLATSSIDGSKIIDASIDGSKLAGNSITGGHIIDGQILEKHILDGQVTSSKIKDGAITEEKIADGAITTSKIADNSITSDKIVDGTILSEDLASNAVTTEKIVNGTIISDDIANNTITGPKIKDSAITSIKIAIGAVTEEKLAANSINSEKIIDGEVKEVDIADGTIIAENIGDDAITSAKILDGSITGDKISTNSITTGKIQNETISSEKISDNAIQSAHIVDESVQSYHIANFSILGSETSDFLKPFSSFESHISPGTIGSADIKSGSITGAKITTGAITNEKIANSSITASKLVDNLELERLGINKTVTVADVLSVESQNNNAAIRVYSQSSDDHDLVSFYDDTNVRIGAIVKNGSTVTYEAFTGAHWFSSDTDLVPHALVCFVEKQHGRVVEGVPYSEPIYKVVLCDEKNNTRVAGTVTSSKKDSEYGYRGSVAANGNGYVLLINTGEDITIGEYLVASDRLGYAEKDMKEYPISNIVAKVVEPIQWKNITTRLEDGTKYTVASVYYQFFRVENKNVFEQKVHTIKAEIEVLEERIERLERK